MKTKNILTNHLYIRRPKRLPFLSSIRIANDRDVIAQRIQPYIHHLRVIAWYWHTPAEVLTRTRNRHIFQAILHQFQKLFFAKFWHNFHFARFNRLANVVRKSTGLKIIIFFAQPLVRRLMVRTNTVIFSRFFVSDERLATLAIPTLVRTFVDIASRSQLLPNILHRANVMRVSCADKIRRRDIQLGNHVLEIAMHLVDIGLWCLILASSLSSNFIAMLIHACLETYFAPVLPLIARPYVC